jgi:two-component system chemotaxis response regulator CheY
MAVCLIVDDSLIARLVARKAVAAMGYDVREAVDGKAALVACAASMPDAILVDWNMPVMNGIDFLKQLRAMPGGDVPGVIFCTSEDHPGHLQSAIGVGADGCIVKPLSDAAIQRSFSQAGLIGIA